MRVAVASGKGGTGKTLLSTSLAWHLGSEGTGVTYVDTDVAEPNGHLLLSPKIIEERRFVVNVPGLAGQSCSACGACQDGCAFGAIRVVDQGVAVDAKACHACGACSLICEEDALTESPREVGTLCRGLAGPVHFWSATLDVGEAKAPPLIRGLLEAAFAEQQDIVIMDAPPGTSSNTMTVIRRADHVVLITEPTPFGLHDLDLAVQMCKGLERPLSVVLNRADLGNQDVLDFIAEASIPMLAQIPFSREIAAAHARHEIAAQTVSSLGQAIAAAAERLVQL